MTLTEFPLAIAGAVVVFVVWYAGGGILRAVFGSSQDFTLAEWEAHRAALEVIALRVEGQYEGKDLPEMIRLAVEDMKTAPPTKGP